MLPTSYLRYGALLVVLVCCSYPSHRARASALPASSLAAYELTVDLSQGHGSFVETLLLPGDKRVEVLGELRPVSTLTAGSTLTMEHRRLGILQAIRVAEPRSASGAGGAQVVGVSRVVSTEKVVVRMANDAIETTPDHLFYIASRGWTPARRLRAGDLLDTATAAGRVAVDSVTESVVPARAVFDLIVEGVHTFRVGRHQVLVHNGGDCALNVHEPDEAIVHSVVSSHATVSRAERLALARASGQDFPAIDELRDVIMAGPRDESFVHIAHSDLSKDARHLVASDMKDARVSDTHIDFPAPTGPVSALHEGDLVLSGEHGKSFVRRITSVTKSDTGIRVATEDASVLDAAERLSIHGNVTVPSIGVDRGGTKLFGNKFANVTCTKCELMVDPPRINFGAHFYKRRIDYFAVEVDAKFHAALELAAQANKDVGFKKDFQLFKHTEHFQHFTQGLPLWESVTISLNARLEGGLHAGTSITTGASVSQDFKAASMYDGGHWLKLRDASGSAKFDPPKFDIGSGGSAKMTLTPKVDVTFWNSVGADIRADASVAASVKPTLSALEWKANSALSVNVEGHADFFRAHASVESELLRRSKTFLHGSIPYSRAAAPARVESRATASAGVASSSVKAEGRAGESRAEAATTEAPQVPAKPGAGARVPVAAKAAPEAVALAPHSP